MLFVETAEQKRTANGGPYMGFATLLYVICIAHLSRAPRCGNKIKGKRQKIHEYDNGRFEAYAVHEY